MTIIREKKIKPNLHIENNETHKKPLQIINIADPPISTKVQFLSLLIALQSIVHLLHWSLFEQLLDTCERVTTLTKMWLAQRLQEVSWRGPTAGWQPPFSTSRVHISNIHTCDHLFLSLKAHPQIPWSSRKEEGKTRERSHFSWSSVPSSLLFCQFHPLYLVSYYFKRLHHQLLAQRSSPSPAPILLHLTLPFGLV